ncbi:MAG: PilZ domain-containing protein [Deltaproteobacteria bacterium]|nr:PilZ domain-containing protein [Deltaproteobacteria bacterium]MBW2193010.1 PilZ domain-containing protein [Deltaproteobacteria bacterium]
MGNDKNKRKTDRLYSIKPTQIQLKGNVYTLNDISTEGLGVIVDDPHTFFSGQSFDAIPVKLSDNTVFLKGIVTHITKNERNYVCGIRFLLAGIEEYKLVTRFKKERAL